MKWLVTGAAGMLGREVVQLLEAGPTPEDGVVGLGRAELDITDVRAVHGAMTRIRPDVVVNCAAFTGVDAAEEHPAEARRINADGAVNIAKTCATADVRLVHVSTDYVFSGEGHGTPYAEDAPRCASSVYGSTKLAGERAVLSALPGTAVIARTAWLYGEFGDGFVRHLVRQAELGAPVGAIHDQRGQPTWTRDLAERILALGGDPRAAGIYHCTNGGETTWFDLAREVYRLAGADPALVRAISAAELSRPAHRPAYSVLGHARWSETPFPAMRDWRAALSEAMGSLRSRAGTGRDGGGTPG